ncbi:la-related protein 6-like [Centruroides sculpturatus]|uniref:la-related protein 6-like n=1 Tax=Centruroides sculpturatus TaxID=218467 RepID=UPI000C6D460C|nr:la-related protein 6-like [Centruroides sculpturatus]
MDNTGEVRVPSVPGTDKKENPTVSVTCSINRCMDKVSSSPVVRRKEQEDSSGNQSSDSDNLDLSGHKHNIDSYRCKDATGEGQNAFVVPDKELVDKINGQIEQYFSDENILKDPFLLKHVRRNKEGYVSLKLIASFRKVKSLTKDWRVVAHSLKQSLKLEVNEEETKVRRKEPLPAHDETTVSRTVVAYNLPFVKPTVENVGEIFSKFGEISLIRILRPGASVPPEVKRLSNKHPEISSDVCALIEFETYESALKAVKPIPDYVDLQVVPIVQRVPKKENSTQKVSPHVGSQSDKNGEGGKKKKRGKKPDRLEEIRGEESESPFVSSCSEAENSPKPRKRSSGSVGSCYLAQYRNECNGYRRGSFGNTKSPVNSPVVIRRCFTNTSYRPKSHSYCEGDLMASLSTSGSWIQKRPVTANGHFNNNCINSRLLIPEGVIRLPRGPDGTKGFNSNRTHQFAIVNY